MSDSPENDISYELEKIARIEARVLEIKLGVRDDCGREGIDPEMKYLKKQGLSIPASVRIIKQKRSLPFRGGL